MAMTRRADATERRFEAAERLRGRGYFSRAESLYRGLISSAPFRSESLLALASIARSLGRVSQARVFLARLAVLPESRLGEFRERVSLEKALIDRAAGRYPAALKALSRHLARFRREGDKAGQAFVLWASGGARRFAGDLKGSERDFCASLSAARAAKDAAGQAYALFGLGGVTRIAGRLKDAERFYAEAGRRLAKTDDVFGKAYARCGLANALRRQGRIAEARKLYAVAHKLYSALDDEVDLAYVLWGQGQCALTEGRLFEARRLFIKGLKFFRAGNEERGIALSLMSLSQLAHAQGRPGADRLFDAAVKTARRAGLKTYLESYT